MTAFTIDPAHTDILFSAKHMMVTTVRGTFTAFDGSLDLDESEPTRSTATFHIKAASIDTSFAARDNHLRSADFFDVERYPEIVVRSTGIRVNRRGDYVVTADVAIREVTRSVDFDVDFLGFYPAMDGARRAGFTARARINRKDWDLNWNVALEAGGWLVGDEIKLDIDVALEERVAVAA